MNIVAYDSLFAEISHTESTHQKVDFCPLFLLTIFTVCSFIASRTFTNEIPYLIMACTSMSTWISSALVYVCGKEVFNSLVISDILHFKNSKYYIRLSLRLCVRPSVLSSVLSLVRRSICLSVHPSIRPSVLQSVNQLVTGQSVSSQVVI